MLVSYPSVGGDLDHRVHSRVRFGSTITGYPLLKLLCNSVVLRDPTFSIDMFENFHSSYCSGFAAAFSRPDSYHDALIEWVSPWPQNAHCGNDLETAFISSTCPYTTAIRPSWSPSESTDDRVRGFLCSVKATEASKHSCLQFMDYGHSKIAETLDYPRDLLPTASGWGYLDGATTVLVTGGRAGTSLTIVDSSKVALLPLSIPQVFR
ncbi:hypothetical protein FNV43_RR09633 [Rhamnella rubrinervis]|uniref:Uncharacterized protein n=1 Tax=Rhamnella rubrinervis TaxID=2594499 RepID=A0A8K0HAT3_9ROSA|nr:hypothetical protein FNV43_RR09633 [Rhamnella rubrinervis]